MIDDTHAGSDVGPEEEEFMERVVAPVLLELEKWLGHLPSEAEFNEWMSSNRGRGLARELLGAIATDVWNEEEKGDLDTE